MAVEIKEYIESGALEAYVMGSASEQEIQQLLALKARYPEVSDALNELEEDLERIAMHMAVAPPPGTWLKIEDELSELAKQEQFKSVKITSAPSNHKAAEPKNTGDFIEVQGPSSHMRVHKIWRWIFAAIFILGKIFLGFAIFYYLESRQEKEQIRELKQELRQLKNGRH